MAKRQTGIRLSKLTDSQIADFVRDFEMTQADVVATAVDRFHAEEYGKRKSGAVYAPIYQKFFVMCKAGDTGAVEVFGYGEDDIYTTYLRQSKLSEITLDTAVYVQIKHQVEYPYSAVDFTEPLSELDKKLGNEQRRYCQAAIVATPKLSLF